MGTCETGVLRCFDARHEASMRSEWLYEPAQECRRRHAADVPTGPMRKEIPAPGLPERGDVAGWCGGGGGVWCSHRLYGRREIEIHALRA